MTLVNQYQCERCGAVGEPRGMDLDPPEDWGKRSLASRREDGTIYRHSAMTRQSPPGRTIRRRALSCSLEHLSHPLPTERTETPRRAHMNLPTDRPENRPPAVWAAMASDPPFGHDHRQAPRSALGTGFQHLSGGVSR